MVCLSFDGGKVHISSVSLCHVTLYCRLVAAFAFHTTQVVHAEKHLLMRRATVHKCPTYSEVRIAPLILDYVSVTFPARLQVSEFFSHCQHAVGLQIWFVSTYSIICGQVSDLQLPFSSLAALNRL